MKKQFREAEFLTSKDLHSFTNLQKEKEEKICRIIFHSVKLLDKAETQYSCLWSSGPRAPLLYKQIRFFQSAAGAQEHLQKSVWPEFTVHPQTQVKALSYDEKLYVSTIKKYFSGPKLI